MSVKIQLSFFSVENGKKKAALTAALIGFRKQAFACTTVYSILHHCFTSCLLNCTVHAWKMRLIITAFYYCQDLVLRNLGTKKRLFDL